MSKEDDKRELPEVLFDIFYSMINGSGVVLNQKAIENMQAQSRRQGLRLQKLIQRETRSALLRLQEATAAGFKAVANDIARLDEKCKCKGKKAE